MGQETKIQWCDHTYNPWRGCQKISEGCLNCYAEKQSHRNPAVLGEWGPNGTRVIASEDYWRLPVTWNRQAERDGVRRRVFCASLADIFEDRPELEEPRRRVFDTILATPHLDWLLLTKRPEVARDWLLGLTPLSGSLPHSWGKGWDNVWLGVSVENQARAKERIPILLAIPAAVHWLSCEPLLGPLDLADYLHHYHGRPPRQWSHGRVEWVIVGGESGGGARPFHVEWARGIRQQCQQANVACFLKQMGAEPRPSPLPSDVAVRFIRDPKGGDPDEWPEDLRIREFPRRVTESEVIP